MDAYGVEPYHLLQTNAKINSDSKYDHWTFERLGNSSEETWVASSPMDAYGVEPYHLVQTDAKINTGN